MTTATSSQTRSQQQDYKDEHKQHHKYEQEHKNEHDNTNTKRIIASSDFAAHEAMTLEQEWGQAHEQDTSRRGGKA